MKLTDVYLELASYIYLSIILFFYLRRKKINTIENKIYKAMIITSVLVCLSDVISTIVAREYPTHIVSELLVKWKLICMALELIFCTYYIFCITSKKSAGIIDFKDHPHRKHFIIYGWIMIVTSIIFTLLIIIGNINITMNNNVFEYTGTSLTFCHIASLASAVCWLLMFIKVLKDITNKKYRQLLILLLVGIATIVMTFLFPVYSLSTPAIAFITAVIFFTMENPDATLISKLNEAKSNAEDANKNKTDFLSSMSHEIRTPLNAIVGFGQALAKEDISGSAKEEVHDILMASNTLLDIVNGILDISKIESNKIEIVNNNYSTKKLVNEITSLINARIGSKPLDFKVLTDENLPAVLYGDQMRIKQIIINLLTNAVKYTKEGRILFQIKAENTNDNCKLIISVQDTGIGMTKEAIEKIFSKYERFDMKENVHIEGTGLGMAITKSLVELMNGNIEVKSIYGEGSTFIVTINQKIVQMQHEEQTEELDTNQTVFDASGSRVLVVDDNKINLKVAERLLSDYNITVETANSGSECIDYILDGKKYDFIFMDIMMPKMNGIETLENLKNIVGFNMPVVALTADVISGMEDKYISKGFDDCLAKPIVEEELYHLLRKFLKEAPSTSVVPDLPEIQPVMEIPKVVETPTVELPAMSTPTPVVEQQPVVETPVVEEPNKDEIHSVELLKNNKIDVDAGLELLKDMEMYDMTLEEFYNELQNKLKDLKEYKESGNMDDYAILAHALKTEARYVGCSELGDIAYEHELAGKASNQQKVNETYDQLEQEANRVYGIIKRYFGE